MPDDHPIVTEEAVWKHAEVLALRDGRWGGRLVGTFDQMDRVQRDGYLAQARRDLEAIAPLIQEQVEERVRERLLTAKVLEAVVKRRDPLYKQYTKAALTAAAVNARLDIETALNALDQDSEQ